MDQDRLLAEWLNLCDATDRMGDGIGRLKDHPADRSYIASQAAHAVRYSLRVFFGCVSQCGPAEYEALRAAIQKAAFHLDNPNGQHQATGERRGG